MRFFKLYMEVSWNRGTPSKIIHFKWAFPLSTIHLGIPPFMEPPTSRMTGFDPWPKAFSKPRSECCFHMAWAAMADQTWDSKWSTTWVFIWFLYGFYPCLGVQTIPWRCPICTHVDVSMRLWDHDASDAAPCLSADHNLGPTGHSGNRVPTINKSTMNHQIRQIG